MPGPASRLIDWQTASALGRRLAGAEPSSTGVERARLSEDFGEVVPEAERLVTAFTGLAVTGYRSRPWVQTRGEWIDANLRGFQRLLDPFAERILAKRHEGPASALRRKVLGAQVGALTGYLSRKVLGQYDLFLPPDDDGLLYFVGQNVTSVERRFNFPSRDFRLWLCLHEVTHRVQFGAVPWLRGHMAGLVNSYLASVEVDPAQLLQSLKRAVGEARRSGEWRGLGLLFLLMTPEQRDTFRRMQAAMSLLEGHGNYVMNAVAGGRIPEAARMRRNLRNRRQAAGVERAFQRAIGLDTKILQYDAGERFVARAVQEAGMDGFNRVWQSEQNLPTLGEVGRPEEWVARVITR
jgi:coenzyme F420 biosynthesis associated uncharacterized protein